MPVLHFSSVSALFEKGVSKSKINRMHTIARTNKLGNFWQLNEVKSFIRKLCWAYNSNCSLIYRNKQADL